LLMTQNDVITMHGSVVEYRGQWYIFYHNGALSGGIGPLRSICFDPLYFNADGTIQLVQKSLGVKLPTFHDAINFNAMFGTLDVGEYTKAELRKAGIKAKAISSIQIPDGYRVTCYEKNRFKGQSWAFETDYIDLNALDCNDKISSLKICKTENDNLVKNPSFELSTQKMVKYWRSKDLACTSRLDTSGDAYYALQYEGKGAPKEVVQKVALRPHTNYQLSVLMKIEEGTVGQVIFDTKGAYDESCSFALDAGKKAGEWLEFSGAFNSGEAKFVNLRCTTSEDFEGSCSWDRVVLKER